MTIFSRKSSLLYTALASLMILSSCSGGSSTTEPSPTPSTQVNTAASGVVATKSGVADGNFYALQSAGAAIPVNISLATGIKLSDLNFTVQSPRNASLEKTATGFVIRMTTQADTGTQYVDVVSKNSVTGATEILRVPVTVMAPTKISTGNVSSSGGSVTPASGKAITFPAGNNLSAPINVTVREVATPNGDQLINLSFDKDISNTNLAVIFPDHGVNLDAASTSITNTPTQKSLSIAAKAVLTTSDPYPQTLDNTQLGENWVPFNAYFHDQSQARLPNGVPIPVSSLCKLLSQSADCFAIPVSLRVSAELNSTLTFPTATDTFDLGSSIPVLFVHGFTPSGLGGGQKTWEEFPALAKKNGQIPFEFRWNTNARFVDAAADLARAIVLISMKTGNRKVLIVAHSFGGVLARTVLQGLASNISSNTAATAKDRVAGLLTLGSPHSGILDTSTAVSTSDNATTFNFPAGQDAWIFEACSQLSCHVMGELVSSLSGAAGVYKISSTPGEHAANLASTRSQLPPIPIHVGIGLRVTYQGTTPVFGPGDGLISYAGQRFLPSAGQASLRNEAIIGAAKVTEKILGITRDVTPGITLSASENSATLRGNGYLHSTTTGAQIQVTPNATMMVGALSLVDGRTDQSPSASGGQSIPYNFGIEAAPKTGCDAIATCTHAGFLMFKDLVTEVATTSVAPSGPLALSGIQTQFESVFLGKTGTRYQLSRGAAPTSTSATVNNYAYYEDFYLNTSPNVAAGREATIANNVYSLSPNLPGVPLAYRTCTPEAIGSNFSGFFKVFINANGQFGKKCSNSTYRVAYVGSDVYANYYDESGALYRQLKITDATENFYAQQYYIVTALKGWNSDSGTQQLQENYAAFSSGSGDFGFNAVQEGDVVEIQSYDGQRREVANIVPVPANNTTNSATSVSSIWPYFSRTDNRTYTSSDGTFISHKGLSVWVANQPRFSNVSADLQTYRIFVLYNGFVYTGWLQKNGINWSLRYFNSTARTSLTNAQLRWF